ncbi:hypothetical protein GLOTRDRAFT_50099, partial [Gloeophyllum trabeum ATCC 11539]
CDDWYLDGTFKPSNVTRRTFNYAMKIRASMTYGFGRFGRRGTLVWDQSRSRNGRWRGNPSISYQVSSYMASLKRRKVQNGETPTSARAITPEIMAQLYEVNNLSAQAEILEIDRRSGKKKSHDQWGGGRLRRCLHCMYTFAFSCLLRFDEVLNIKAHDVIPDPKHKRLILRLSQRKNAQFGDLEPFYLYIYPEEDAHLCPYRAYAEWVHVSGITKGYLFRNFRSHDRICRTNTKMPSRSFLGYFRHNLLDVKRDPVPYGTHSFRRGGTQWLHCDKRWGIRKICEWGGWATTLPPTIVLRYLISYVDDPRERREDFMDFRRKPTVVCPNCGRSCHCSW